MREYKGCFIRARQDVIERHKAIAIHYGISFKTLTESLLGPERFMTMTPLARKVIVNDLKRQAKKVAVTKSQIIGG